MKHIEAPKDDLRERFILFCAGKPADQQYDWQDSKRCPCGTFIRQCLTTYVTKRAPWWFPWISSRTVKTVNHREATQVWERWNFVASIQPRVYGALLERVQSVDTRSSAPAWERPPTYYERDATRNETIVPQTTDFSVLRVDESVYP